MDILAFLPLVSALLLLLITAAWIYSEIRARGAIRIALGILSIAGWTVMAIWLGGIGPAYESSLHRSALEQAGKSFEAGKVESVRKAVQVYNDQVAITGSSYHASKAMVATLRRETEGEGEEMNSERP
jgi:hypothetical protein